jgi:hypothetical protein
MKQRTHRAATALQAFFVAALVDHRSLVDPLIDIQFTASATAASATAIAATAIASTASINSTSHSEESGQWSRARVEFPILSRIAIAGTAAAVA